MSSQKLMWASLVLAMLGCSPLRGAEESSVSPSERARLKAAVEIAGAPIPQDASAKTERDLSAQYLDWYKRILLPPLQAAAKGQPWEADAMKFAEDSFAAWTAMDRNNLPAVWSEFSERGDGILKSGCAEPTIRFLTAHAKIMARRERNRSLTEYRRLLRELEKDPHYPRAFALLVGLSLSGSLGELSPNLEQQIVDLQRQSFEEGSYAGADDTLFVDGIMNVSGLLARHSDAMEKLVTRLQKLPEWARETILGKIEINRAWKARGSGWASSVTEEGIKGFNESLAKARGHLEAAWKARPDQPYAAGEMITVVMGSEAQPSANLRLWFDRAVKARFDYDAAYFSYTWAIRPRWGGSYEEMLAFGLACAATKRYDTSVPRRLMRTLDDIGEETTMRRAVYRLPGVGDAVVAVGKGYVAAQTRPELKAARLSKLTLDSWLCEKWEDAKAALDQLPDHELGKSLHDRLTYFGVARNNVMGETLIYAGPARDDYAKAKELEKGDHYAEAAPHFAAALKACESQPVPRGLITFLSKINDRRAAMANGEWRDISPKIEDHSDWWLPPGSSVPADGVLQVQGRGETILSQWRTPVGENYEVRATFEFMSPMDQAHRFDISLGDSSERPEEYVTCGFDSGVSLKGKAYMLHGFKSTAAPVVPVELEMKNHLDVQCWHRLLSVYLNGKKVFEKFQASEGSPSEHYGTIGFGGYKLTETESFRVSNIAARILKEEPAPPEKFDDDK